MIDLKDAYFYDLDLLLKFRLDIVSSNEKIKEDNKNIITEREKNSVMEHIKDYKLILKDDKIIGSILLYKNNNSNFLREIYLLEEYRNKEIGSTILKRLIKNCKDIFLYVYKDNKKQVSFFKELGFQIKEEKNNKLLMCLTNNK